MSEKEIRSVMPIREWKICNCGKGDWQVVDIQTDDQLEHRFKTLLSSQEQKAVLRDMKRRGETLSKIQYILKMRCRGCGFEWNKFVTERQLETETLMEMFK